MDVRKIIGFGKSTFSVTLPRKWVLANNLKKGDTVTISEYPGKLEIIPWSGAKPPAKAITIPIEGRPIKRIQREFIAAYIKGYSVINLTGSHEGKVSELRRRLHELVAVEIMELTSTRITAHVFFDISTISLPRVISRIELITKTILNETQELLRSNTNREVKYSELLENKRDVDRQSLFAIRIIVKGLTDPSFAATLNSDPLKLSFTWHMIERMEKVSDYFLNTAFYMTSTPVLKSLGKKSRDDLHRIFTAIGKNYADALHSYNTNSLSLANHVIDTHIRNNRLLYTYISSNQKIWVPTITGYLRRVSSKSRDIARITINVNTK